MKLVEQSVKRLIIYFFYDRDGIVDDYIPYMLADLKKNSAEIAFVANGKLTPESRAKVAEYTNTIIVRENKGLDVWAYKTALDYYGWEKLSAFDEVVMMNFTIMGPVYPLHEMFEEMDSRDIDFWGITEFHEYKAGDPFGTIELGYIPTHIQSHFIAVRSSMLNSIDYHMYWDNMGEIRDYRDAVGKHEAMFTHRFSEKGFTWSVYADMGDNYNNHPVLEASNLMLEEKRCPIFKRRSFMQDYSNIIHDTLGEATLETLEFLEKKTDYPVDLIWQNILRLENQADIKTNAQLNYILSSTRGNDISDILSKRKVALILHFYFDDLADYCLHYMESLPKEVDIYVTVGSEAKKKLIDEKFASLPNKVTTILVENRGRDVSALLVGTKDFIMDYDYACFVHDKKVTQLSPETIGYGFSYKCFENLLTSVAFVENVLRTMEENPRVGLMCPPPPNHGDYYITMGLEWGTNYKVTKKLANELGITVPICKEKEPIAPLGTMFWFRPQAMKLLFDKDWKYEDFPPEPNKTDGTLLHACERIYSYTVQQEGYYPAWIFSDKGARIEITNLYYMLRQLNTKIFFRGSGAGDFESVSNKLNQAFGEWRLLRPMLDDKENISFSKLYLKKDGQYSEQLSINCFNKADKKTEGCEFSFDSLQKYGTISELRWDPGEASGTTIKALKIRVELGSGEEATYTMEDVQSNACKVEDRYVFFAYDPKLYFKLPNPEVIRRVVIKGEIVPRISARDEGILNARLNHPYSWRLRKLVKGLTKRR